MEPYKNATLAVRCVDERRRDESGLVLIWVLFFVVIIAGMVASNAMNMSAHRRTIDLRYKTSTLANGFAKSGLTDALAWFRKQTKQPIESFRPKRDPEADPPILETLDPTIGLVREFEVRGQLWGRYEVRNRNTVDISEQRGAAGVGEVWDVGSIGILYERNDPSKPFDVAPNRVVAKKALRTEMRGIPFNSPADAALSVADTSTVNIGTAATIDAGGGAAVATKQGSTQKLTFDGTIAGTQQIQVIGLDTSAEGMFAMRLEQLETLADLRVSSIDALPEIVANDRVVFAQGDLAFKSGRSQRGRMLLVVRGDLTVDAGSDVQIAGVIYVTGNVTIEGNFKLDGMIIAAGNVDVGSGSENADITFDRTAVSAIKRAVRRFRMSSRIRPAAKTTEEVVSSKTSRQLMLESVAVAERLWATMGKSRGLARAFQAKVNKSLTLMTGDSSASSAKVLDTLKSAAETAREIATKIKSGKVDAAHAPDARLAALLITQAARRIAVTRVDAAMASGTNTSKAVGEIKAGDASQVVQSKGLAPVEFYDWETAIAHYKKAWKAAKP